MVLRTENIFIIGFQKPNSLCGNNRYGWGIEIRRQGGITHVEQHNFELIFNSSAYQLLSKIMDEFMQ